MIPIALIEAGLGAASKLGGGGSGKATGSSGGIGSDLISGGMSAGLGLIQSIQANKLKSKANAAFPEFYDPQQQAFLAELGQKRKAMETGAEFAGGMNAINASTAGTNNAIVQAGGGDVGGTIQGLLQSARVGEDAKNRVLATGQQENLQYNNMYREMLDKIAGRKMELQLMKHDENRAEWAAKQQAASQNLLAGISKMSSPFTGKSAPNFASGALGANTGAMAGSISGAGGGSPEAMSLLNQMQGYNMGAVAPAGTTVGNVGFSNQLSSIAPSSGGVI